MVAGASKRGDGKMHRRHAARRTDGADAVFQRREPLLQHRRGRVGNARVDVAGAFQVEQPGGVIGIVEHVGRRLVDRDGARAGDRIGMLPGMQAQGLERRGFWSGHAFLAVRKLRQRCNVVERLGHQPSVPPTLRANRGATQAGPRDGSGHQQRYCDFGAGDGKPPISPLRTEITGVFSAAGRRFVARFVVFRQRCHREDSVDPALTY